MSRQAWITRPADTADPASRTRHPTVGVLLAVAGMMLVAVAALVSGPAISQVTTDGGSGGSFTGAFALNTFGLGVTKLRIAVVLIGFVLALWRRVDAVRDALPTLRAAARPHEPSTHPSTASLTTQYGTAKVTSDPPGPLLIHRMAERLWLPVLAMGAMILVIGLFVGLSAANADPADATFRSLNAWSQGTLFLGEGLLLTGIAFLLGTILSGLRRGGGEVQQASASRSTPW